MVESNEKVQTDEAASGLSDRLGVSEACLAELLGRMRTLEIDHMPDDWPAVKMEDVSALCDAVVRLNTKLRVEVEELREAASSAVLAYGAHAHAQLRELFNESKSEDTRKALDALALAMSNLDTALQAHPAAPQGRWRDERT